MKRLALRVAAISLASDAVFGVLMPAALYKLNRDGQLPLTPFGFRAYSGPFERLGNRGFTALGLALMVSPPRTWSRASACGEMTRAAHPLHSPLPLRHLHWPPASLCHS